MNSAGPSNIFEHRLTAWRVPSERAAELHAFFHHVALLAELNRAAKSGELSNLLTLKPARWEHALVSVERDRTAAGRTKDVERKLMKTAGKVLPKVA